jgi:hypothetical protein
MAYIDTVINKGKYIPGSINFNFFANGIPDSTERVVHFIEEPEEWYVVSFDVSDPWIDFTYNRRMASEQTIP